MIIFGVDPGIATTGYGVIETIGASRAHVAHGVVRTPQGMPPPQRLRTIFESMNGLFRRFDPDLIAVEELFFSTNVKTAMAVSEARGVILLASSLHGSEIAEFTPNRVKQSVSQNGRADKKDMQNMVKILLGLSETPRPDDAADALAIALCASQEPRWMPAALAR